MSRTLWRIAAHTAAYAADDMSGGGAKVHGGRWNEEGLAVVYTSTTQALACLETVVHLNTGGLPLNRYLVEVRVPDAVWRAATRMTVAQLPVGWDAEPASLTTIRLGSDWLRGNATALFFVPSVMVPDEFNVLLNPVHPDASRIRARVVRKWLFDPRLPRASVSVQDHVEFWDWVVIPWRLPPLAGAARCGPLRTAPGMTGASCAVPLT